MRISDWSSDVCSSDLHGDPGLRHPQRPYAEGDRAEAEHERGDLRGHLEVGERVDSPGVEEEGRDLVRGGGEPDEDDGADAQDRKRVVEGKRVSVRVELVGRRTSK